MYRESIRVYFGRGFRCISIEVLYVVTMNSTSYNMYPYLPFPSRSLTKVTNTYQANNFSKIFSFWWDLPLVKNIIFLILRYKAGNLQSIIINADINLWVFLLFFFYFILNFVQWNLLWQATCLMHVNFLAKCLILDIVITMYRQINCFNLTSTVWCKIIPDE